MVYYLLCGQAGSNRQERAASDRSSVIPVSVCVSPLVNPEGTGLTTAAVLCNRVC